MKISVKGAGIRKSNKIRKAVEFYANYLMHKNKTKRLNIEVEVDKSFDYNGSCISEEDSKSPDYFTIQLKDSDEDSMFRTLAHEMVHLKQYARGELTKDLVYRTKQDDVYIKTLWNGKPYKFKSHESEYYDSPWEIEAFGREEHLLWKFQNRT